MNKERLERIGKFLNDRMIIHRNVENNTPWTTEEKMIQELYDNYLDILIKYKKQKEFIDKIFSRITLLKMEDITMENSKVLDDLLDILKEGKNEWDMETYKRFWKYIWNI